MIFGFKNCFKPNTALSINSLFSNLHYLWSITLFLQTSLDSANVIMDFIRSICACYPNFFWLEILLFILKLRWADFFKLWLILNICLDCLALKIMIRLKFFLRSVWYFWKLGLLLNLIWVKAGVSYWPEDWCTRLDGLLLSYGRDIFQGLKFCNIWKWWFRSKIIWIRSNWGWFAHFEIYLVSHRLLIFF